MEEVIENLKRLEKDILELKDFTIRSKNFGSGVEAAAFKNIEEGIIKNLHKANKEQLHSILNNYKFRYYHEFNSDKNLIIKEFRDNKLNQVFNGSC